MEKTGRAVTEKPTLPWRNLADPSGFGPCFVTAEQIRGAALRNQIGDYAHLGADRLYFRHPVIAARGRFASGTSGGVGAGRMPPAIHKRQGSPGSAEAARGHLEGASAKARRVADALQLGLHACLPLRSVAPPRA